MNRTDSPHPDAPREPAGRFTGRHMAIILVAFFGVVIAVNVVMARLAISSFGGTVVENSYVASQKYNSWIEQGRKQAALGWKPVLARDGAGHATLGLTGADGQPIGNAQIQGLAQHPLGRADDIALDFVATAPGQYRSTRPLPAGRWQMLLKITSAGELMRHKGEVR